MLIKLYKVFVVGTECSRAYHLACSYVRNLEGVIPLPGLAFERIECFPASWKSHSTLTLLAKQNSPLWP